jgi:hypothetical protein
MALTNAERQKRYRDKQWKSKGNGDVGRHRLNLYVQTMTWIRLKNLAFYHALTMEGMLDLLIAEADEQVVELLRLNRDRERSSAYMHGRLRKDGTVVK